MIKFKSFDSMLDHILSHYSIFADRPAEREFVMHNLEALAKGQAEDPAIDSANFSAVISPILTCGVIIPVMLTISCENPADWKFSQWKCIAQSKQVFEKLNK